MIGAYTYIYIYIRCFGSDGWLSVHDVFLEIGLFEPGLIPLELSLSLSLAAPPKVISCLYTGAGRRGGGGGGGGGE
jgi:hypothetical protein